MTLSDDTQAEGKVPFWKNPYLVAFVLGAAVLTVMPFMQRKFLKAPPPIRALPAWQLQSLGGGDVSSTALSGQVLLLTLEEGPCDEACVQRQRDFGTAVRHVDDLKTPVTLVTLVGAQAEAALSPLITEASPAWRFARTDTTFIAQLQEALDAFLQRAGPPMATSHAIVLLDQNNAVRGFWPGDGAGRGNSINAARLLSKEGPSP